jgi:hypothetical protein
MGATVNECAKVLMAARTVEVRMLAEARVCAMTLFRNKYRIESSRLNNWDYSNNPKR